jgi:hypothetical protein
LGTGIAVAEQPTPITVVSKPSLWTNIKNFFGA